jgi:hypothetical protein
MTLGSAGVPGTFFDERKMKKSGERMKREKVKGENEGVVSENQAGCQTL